jgi:hypothetical protein
VLSTRTSASTVATWSSSRSTTLGSCTNLSLAYWSNRRSGLRAFVNPFRAVVQRTLEHQAGGCCGFCSTWFGSESMGSMRSPYLLQCAGNPASRPSTFFNQNPFARSRESQMSMEQDGTSNNKTKGREPERRGGLHLSEAHRPRTYTTPKRTAESAA